MFYDEEEVVEVVETDAEAKEREKNTHRLRREFLKREKEKGEFEDKFERQKSKKRKASKNKRLDYGMED